MVSCLQVEGDAKPLNPVGKKGSLVNRQKQRVLDAWSGMKERAESVKDRVSDVPRERLDTEVGIFLHKNVGTLFYFDSQVREYEEEIIRLARNGEKEKAMMVSMEMESYIKYGMEHDRRYQKRLSEIADELEGRGDQFRSKLEGLSDSRIVSWLEKMNKQGKKDFEEEFEEVEE